VGVGDRSGRSAVGVVNGDIKATFLCTSTVMAVVVVIVVAFKTPRGHGLRWLGHRGPCRKHSIEFCGFGGRESLMAGLRRSVLGAGDGRRLGRLERWRMFN